MGTINDNLSRTICSGRTGVRIIYVPHKTFLILLKVLRGYKQSLYFSTVLTEQEPDEDDRCKHRLEYDSGKTAHRRYARGESSTQKMFREFDPNGNGILSLAEVDKAVRDVLELDEIFDAKPAIMRAFQAAKASTESKRGAQGDSYIELREFKTFLLSLRQFFE